MLMQAQCDAWEQVDALERDRKRLVSQEVARGDSTEAHLEIQACLKNIIELNDKVIALTLARRAELVKQLGYLNQGRKANQVYRGLVFPQ
jgi:hypothetical protein